MAQQDFYEIILTHTSVFGTGFSKWRVLLLGPMVIGVKYAFNMNTMLLKKSFIFRE